MLNDHIDFSTGNVFKRIRVADACIVDEDVVGPFECLARVFDGVSHPALRPEIGGHQVRYGAPDSVGARCHETELAFDFAVHSFNLYGLRIS